MPFLEIAIQRSDSEQVTPDESTAARKSTGCVRTWLDHDSSMATMGSGQEDFSILTKRQGPPRALWNAGTSLSITDPILRT